MGSRTIEKWVAATKTISRNLTKARRRGIITGSLRKKKVLRIKEIGKGGTKVSWVENSIGARR